MNAMEVSGLDAKFDHAAVAAPRIRDLLLIYRDLLGGQFVHGGDNPRVGYRALQLQHSNGERIELMEPLAGSTFFDSFFEARPRGGLHHVTYLVDDISKALEVMEQRGLTPVGIHLETPRWREAFLHPREANGVLIQVAVKSEPHVEEEYAGVTLEDVLAGEGPRGNGIPSP